MQNKRGLLSSNQMFILFILVIVCTSLIAVNEGLDRDKLLLTLDNSSKNALYSFDYTNETNSSLINIIYAYFYIYIYILFEIVKMAIIWATNNPDLVNPYVMINLILLFLITMIFFYLAVPLFKIGVIIFLLIKEYYQNKKEKRLLNVRRNI